VTVRLAIARLVVGSVMAAAVGTWFVPIVALWRGDGPWAAAAYVGGTVGLAAFLALWLWAMKQVWP
jgi:hypothetical protein